MSADTKSYPIHKNVVSMIREERRDYQSPVVWVVWTRRYAVDARAATASLRRRFPFRIYSASYSVVVDSLVALVAREVKGHARARTSSTG